MQHSTDRFLTTHTGSLPRPEDLIRAMYAKEEGVPVDPAALEREVAAKAEKKGKPIPAIDGLIAATALRHGLHLMTRNVADFEATGVMLINPWSESAD